MSTAPVFPPAPPSCLPRPLGVLHYTCLWLRVHARLLATPGHIVRLWLGSKTPKPSRTDVFNNTDAYLQALASTLPDVLLPPSHRDLLLFVFSARPNPMSCVRFFSSLIQQEKFQVIHSLVPDPSTHDLAGLPRSYCSSWISFLIQACLDCPAPPSLASAVLRFYARATALSIPSGPLHPVAHRFSWSSLNLDEACTQLVRLHELVGNCQQCQKASQDLVEKIQKVNRDWSMPSPQSLPVLVSFLHRARLSRVPVPSTPASPPLL